MIINIKGGTKKCPVCTKSVYMKEEVLAIGSSYHQSCFTCGALGDGSKFEGCGNNTISYIYLHVKQLIIHTIR